MPWVAGPIAGAFFTAGTVAYAVVYTVVSVAIQAGLSAVQKSLAGKQRSNDNKAVPGREITSRGTVEYRSILYGEVRPDGMVRFHGL